MVATNQYQQRLIEAPPRFKRLIPAPFKTSILLYCLFCAIPAFADFVFTAPPRETPEAGEKVYKPLADYLSKFLGEKVVYEHPKTWHRYEKKMKNDEYDFVFDGPHFAAWRIESLHASPLIKLPGSLKFVLVVNKTKTNISSLKNLIGREICTLSPPNLGALTLISMFPHPARQPKYKIINGGFKAVAEAFSKGECDGAIFRSTFYYKKTDPAFRKTTKVIRDSKGLTNQGITVSRRIKPEVREKLVNNLLNGEGRKALQPILNRFYSKANTFMPSSNDDYVDLNLLHDNMIFGW